MTTQAKDYLDLDDGLARIRGNKALYKQMLNLFLGSEEFQAFEDAIANHDNKMAEAKIHGIKGLSGNLSMPALFETSSALNVQLKTGDAEPATLAEYRAAYEETKKHVIEYISSES